MPYTTRELFARLIQCEAGGEGDDGMRAVAKGIGHGYGLSQAGANARAREGWKAEEILTYFYKNIELISE